jgi:trans-aconitate 2-methyltransferase
MVAADGPWATKLSPVAERRPFNEMMEGLYARLSPVCTSVDIWETTYLYALKGVGAIIDLMKATSLAPPLGALVAPGHTVKANEPSGCIATAANANSPSLY